MLIGLGFIQFAKTETKASIAYGLGLVGKLILDQKYRSQVSNIESDNFQNVGLEDYNNISDRIFPYFTTPSIKLALG